MFEFLTKKIPSKKKSENINKKYIKSEFDKLKLFIDNDQMHRNMLNSDMNPLSCRYEDIKPYSYNTIKLNNSKYVNASWINIPEEKSFIASQGPMQSTIEDFWDMCLEHNVGLIIMLCQEYEGGKEKCANYWNGNKTQNNMGYNKIKENNISQDLILREIMVQKNGYKNTFCQLQFEGWPDHGVPEIDKSYIPFVKIFDYVDKYRQKNKTILVHCSAGIGRTGVFLSVYNLYKEISEQIEKGQNEIIFNIFNLVRILKEMRMYSVENVDQYRFIYDFVEKILNVKN